MEHSSSDGPLLNETPSDAPAAYAIPVEAQLVPEFDALPADPFQTIEIPAGTIAREPGPPPYRPGRMVYAMAGLEAGVVGVFWMFGCFFVAAFWGGRGTWSVPNLFATVFYGDNAWLDGFTHATWAGTALIIVIYGLLGALWGLWWKQDRKPLLRLLGALTGIIVYFLFFGFIWTHLAPSIPIFAPMRELQIAHLLWGMSLAGSPAYAGRIVQALSPTSR